MTTALTRFEPLAETLKLSDAMERLLNDSWVLPRSFFGGWSGGMQAPLDLFETDEAYVLMAFLPGVTSDKLDIQVQQNVLSIHGEVHIEQPKEGRWLIQECGNGKFERSIRLPTPVNADQIVATFKDGVLTINLPKAESVKARRITVQAA